MSCACSATKQECATARGEVVNTAMTLCDHIGAWRVRWGMDRMNYRVRPGLYKINEPTKSSPVLVTANYKLTFDDVRKELSGVSAWILVLDTKGVNVWCAAGKGTFGTEELIQKINETELGKYVDHKTLIVPQLGAPGVSAHCVTKATGYKIVYGPVYAKDIKAFLNAGMQATAVMRRVYFSLSDRLQVVPVELVPALKLAPIFLIALAVLNVADGSGITVNSIMPELILYVSSIFIGAVLFQIFLPVIPGRAFALKGWLLGLVAIAAINPLMDFSLWQALSHLLIAPAIVAYLALNFTGASTYTSLSGVLKEMRIAMPLIIVAIVAGIVLRCVPIFIR